MSAITSGAKLFLIKEGCKKMAHVTVHENESLESALKRFRKKVENEGIIKEWKDKQFFMKPSARRREKRKESIRKYRMKQLKRDKSNS
jgi:small subunit ribosomal protein S21